MAQRASIERTRAELGERLRARRSELEQAALTRVQALAGDTATNTEYAEGLRRAVAAALEYGIAVIESGDDRAPPPPPLLLTQARLAARSGVSLDTVLRRYFAGFTLFGDAVMQQAEAAKLQGPNLQRILRAQAGLFDGLIATVTEAYLREATTRRDSPERRRVGRVRRLLAGELLDTTTLEYDLKVHHLGAVTAGPDAAAILRQLAATLDCRMLLVCPEKDVAWAWFGTRRAIDSGLLARSVDGAYPPSTSLALGEPGMDLSGWRLTHRQAQAAHAIAAEHPGRPVRYADVALLVSMLGDDLLVTSLRQLYLTPLIEDRSGGEILLDTLRGYFHANRNVSSAAAALGITRQTVRNRLRTVERILDRSVEACGAELEAMLRLYDARRFVTVN